MAPSRNHEVPLAALAESEDCVRALLALANPKLEGRALSALATSSVFSEEDVRALLPDGAWLLRDASGDVVRVAVVELERRWNSGKITQWAIVKALLARRFRCPVDLIVVSGARTVRRRLARGHVTRGGLSVRVRLVSARTLWDASLVASNETVRSFLLAASLRLTEDEVTGAELAARVRDERKRLQFQDFPPMLRDAFLACLERIDPPDSDELRETLMLTMEMLSDGTLIASKEGRALLKKYGRLLRAEGRVEGRDEGRLDGARRLLVSVLERRFGALSPELRQAIDRSTSELALTGAVHDVVDGEPLESVAARFASAPSE
jgi:hypothetical protein